MGLAGASCELDLLVEAPLCATHPPRARIGREISRRITAAARLLDAAASAGPERPRGRRRVRAALRNLRSAERRIASAIEEERLAAECGTSLLDTLGRARGALVEGSRVAIVPEAAAPEVLRIRRPTARPWRRGRMTPACADASAVSAGALRAAIPSLTVAR